MAVIEIQSLTKIYIRKHLGKTYKTVGIKNLNLEVNENEIFSIIGPNGSGKTTTIKLILGFITPTAGRVSLFGGNGNPRRFLDKIGYVPETFMPVNFLTVYEFLRYLSKLSNKHIPDEKINEIILKLGLEQHSKKLVSELSKGLLQRVAIAQALIHEPELLIFDDPISGLDPVGIRFMRDLILSLKKEGKTIFFSSHLISEVEKISDRVAILCDGELKKVVSQSEFFEKPLEEIFIEAIRA